MTPEQFLQLPAYEMFKVASRKLITGAWTPAQQRAWIQRWMQANTVSTSKQNY